MCVCDVGWDVLCDVARNCIIIYHILKRIEDLNSQNNLKLQKNPAKVDWGSGSGRIQKKILLKRNLITGLRPS